MDNDQEKPPSSIPGENEERPGSSTGASSSGSSTGTSSPDSSANAPVSEQGPADSVADQKSTPGSSTGEVSMAKSSTGAPGSLVDTEATVTSTAVESQTQASAQESSTGAGPQSSSSSPAPPPPSSSATFGPPEVIAVSSAQEATSAVSAQSGVQSEHAASKTESSTGQEPKSAQRTASKTSAGSSKRKKGVKADMSNCRIGFFGAGKIVDAIVKGLIKYTKVPPNRIFVSSKSGRTLDNFKQEGCVVTKRPYDLFAKLDSDVVFMAIHGHVVEAMYKGSRPMALTTNYIPHQGHPLYVLSLIGGMPLEKIKRTLLNPDLPEKKYKLVMHRIMVNTSVAYGLGLGAMDIEPDSKKCSSLVRDLLAPMVKLEYFREKEIDAVCALGGNGLAFIYHFISALSDGGFKMGLPKSLAVKLATKTLQTAAATLLETGKNATELRDSWTSPSGPAIYGIHVLDKQEAGCGIASAVEGAYNRIREQSEQAPK